MADAAPHPNAGGDHDPARVHTSGFGQHRQERAAWSGREIAARMQEQGYHPVVISGAPAAGKSTLLASLLAYLRVEGAMAAHLGLGVLLGPNDEDHGGSTCGHAAEFFHTGVEGFIGGEAPAPAPATSPEPLLVPVVLKPRGNLPEMKFAFLECRCDCGHTEGDRPPCTTIPAILLDYPKGISFLHLAPCTQVATWDGSARARQAEDRLLCRDADFALASALDAYAAVRPVKQRDHHLFLITKWDAYAPPSGPAGRFIAPTLEEVTSVARERFPRSFAALSNLDIEGQASRQKQVMQYCAGIISGRSIVRHDADLRAQLDRYPRVLWSWLYANATHDAGMQRTLFPAPPPARPRWQDSLDRGLAKVLRLIGV